MMRIVLITSSARWTWMSFFNSSIGSSDGWRSFAGVGSFGIRYIQRRDAEDHFAGNAQWLAARGDDPHLRTGGQDRLRDLGRRIDHVFAVVDDQ